MAFRLIQMAQDRWGRPDAPHLLLLVRAGVQFSDGQQAEREDIEGAEGRGVITSHQKLLTRPPAVPLPDDHQ